MKNRQLKKTLTSITACVESGVQGKTFDDVCWWTESWTTTNTHTDGCKCGSMWQDIKWKTPPNPKTNVNDNLRWSKLIWFFLNIWVVLLWNTYLRNKCSCYSSETWCSNVAISLKVTCNTPVAWKKSLVKSINTGSRFEQYLIVNVSEFSW